MEEADDLVEMAPGEGVARLPTAKPVGAVSADPETSGLVSSPSFDPEYDLIQAFFNLCT